MTKNIELTEQDVYTIVNWFQQVEYTNPSFLGKDDKNVYKKLFGMLNSQSLSVR